MEQRATVDIDLEQEMAEQLEQRAEEMHLPVGEYIERVLLDRLERDGTQLPLHT